MANSHSNEVLNAGNQKSGQFEQKLIANFVAPSHWIKQFSFSTSASLHSQCQS
jgi:hypothetical protein